MYKEAGRNQSQSQTTSKTIQTPYEFKVFGKHNFQQIPQIREYLSAEEIIDIQIVAQVLPFKVNSYIVNELIDWDNYKSDPLFTLVFPRKGMLRRKDYLRVKALLHDGVDRTIIQQAVNEIRRTLNPHPAGQLEKNVPVVQGERIEGLQHKYRETALFFPSQGQTCHAYCTFCFRWPQFVSLDDTKMSSKEVSYLVEYLKQNPNITDILFTGGDPMVMSSKLLESYIMPILEDVPHIKNIRIGTKALSYWPFRFTSDTDSEDLLDLFRIIKTSGRHLALMAHFNHPRELKTKAVKQAIKAILGTGAQIRTQSPLLKNINDNPDLWAEMWKKQVSLGMIPYYMFIARNTGAQHYFAVSLEQAWQTFRQAYNQVSGLSRTVRGPSMSAMPGKVQVLGVTELGDEKAFVLRFLQARNPDWVGQPFFAKYDPEAVWLTDLKPLRGEKFFFQE